MAIILLRDMLGMVVETQSGQRLGFLADGEMDVESHLLQYLLVKTHHLPIGAKTLRVHRNQVRAMTSEKIIVDDAAVMVSTETSGAIVPKQTPAGAHFSIGEEGQS